MNRSVVFALTAGAFFGCSHADPPLPRVQIVTSAGSFVVALEDKRAPKTTANFLHYVDARFYNGGAFFRAIPGFVIQGGNKSRERRTDPKLQLEAPMMTGLHNTDGAISMARTPVPDSATSEFFVCDGDQPSLDGSPTDPGYAAFGHVVEGMDVVRKIAHMPADGQLLVNPVKILRVVRVNGGS